MGRLIAIDADRLHQFWPVVRAGLESVLFKAPDTWMPEDVYVSLKSKESLLLMADNAFLVLTMKKGFDGPEGHVWVLYNAGSHDTITTYWPDIQAICRNSGCKRITMETSRKGWEKLGRSLGLVPVKTLYEQIL